MDENITEKLVSPAPSCSDCCPECPDDAPKIKPPPAGYVRKMIDTPHGPMSVLVPEASDKAHGDNLQRLVSNAVQIDMDENGDVISETDPVEQKFYPKVMTAEEHAAAKAKREAEGFVCQPLKGKMVIEADNDVKAEVSSKYCIIVQDKVEVLSDEQKIKQDFNNSVKKETPISDVDLGDKLAAALEKAKKEVPDAPPGFWTKVFSLFKGGDRLVK